MSQRNFVSISFLILLLLIAFTAVAENEGDKEEAKMAEDGSWTGEILDLACYVSKGAKGADHAGCAKSCVKNGQPMGLLTDDGAVVLLAASHKDGKPYEALKELAGGKATVMGTLVERDGVKMVTVTGSKAAS